MKNQTCLVIVVYPGMLVKLKQLVAKYPLINYVIFFNNFKNKPIISRISHSYHFNYTIFKSRMEMIKILKKINFKYIIFHDIDDKFNFNRYLVLPKFLKKNDFVINELKINNKCYISKRIKNNTIITENSIKNYNFAGMSNSSCTIDLIKKINFKANESAKLIFDWILWKKAAKISKGIFTNKVSSFYDVNKKNPTHLPTNFNNKKHINFIKKIRNKHGIKENILKRTINNFWWEL
jgi:hypothetical protein